MENNSPVQSKVTLKQRSKREKKNLQILGSRFHEEPGDDDEADSMKKLVLIKDRCVRS